MSETPTTPQATTPEARILPITRWGEQVMHEPTEPVTDFGAELQQLIADMFATMEAAEGVGLAGTQVGRNLAIFVYDCPDDEGVRHRGVMCNPTVTLPTGRDRNLDTSEEGCLSFPGAFAPLSRPDFATCTGVDEHGEPKTLTGTGLFARCLQHETDHCNGMVFGDHLSTRQRRKLDEQQAQLAPRYPEDWPVSPKLSAIDARAAFQKTDDA